MSALLIERAGPLVTVQDRGRPGALRYGISASGPMDRGAFERAGALVGSVGGESGLEFTRAGVAFSVEASAMRVAFTGGAFKLLVNGEPRDWEARHDLMPSDRVDITPGASGNYGYVRFSREIDVPTVLGSRATNIVAAIGGYHGRALRAGDWLTLTAASGARAPAARTATAPGTIRVVWGLHADGFDPQTRLHFTGTEFQISPQLDRMGVRLIDPTKGFARHSVLTLVSDAIVPGDVQILGDGTPIVLLRDHQPTGGYPRIGTVIAADIDRFAQLRPGEKVRFEPVTPKRARALLMETL